jgi:hypothetical protein
VDDAVEPIERHVLLADRDFQLAPERGGQSRFRDGQILEGRRAFRHPFDVEVEVLLYERSERGLTLVAEGDVLAAPAPPLHRRTPRWAGRRWRLQAGHVH